MRGVTHDEYTDFLARHRTVSVGRSEIRLKGYQRPKVLQPEDFKLETATLWSFPKRGKWATHRSGYRGNWAPQIARNIILRYSQPGDLVLDQMVGGGTTMVECKLTGRDAVGVDVNRDALMLTMDALNFSLEQALAQGKMSLAEKQAAYRQAARGVDPEEFRQDQEERSNSVAPAPSVNGGREGAGEPSIRLYQGDARNLDAVPDASVGLVATHPPYANIIRYTKGADERNPNDLSNVRSIAEYAEQMRRVAEEAHRVLKPGHYCAILMGDTRRNKHYLTIAFRVMQAFLEAGFILKEDIIKAQWNTQTEGLWANLSRTKNFLLIMHEHLFIFRKPLPEEPTKDFAESMRWW